MQTNCGMAAQAAPVARMSTTPAILVNPFIIELASPVVRRALRPRHAAPYLCSDHARRAMAAARRRTVDLPANVP
jgi:hypothetical protein